MDILLFGITRDIIGAAVLHLTAAEPVKTVGDLRKWLTETYPEIGRLRSLAVAVNSEYAGDEVSITGNSEIALIPPVSGG